jgi:pseudaminic acid cytidylyltransferase
MKVAVIPARGGSKRIPRKNIKNFCGKPMIAWSILAAQATGLFDRIVVSTDDTDIADVARDWGAEIPFMRSSELSDDHAGTTEVIAHATRRLIEQGDQLSAVCCIYATSPLIQVDDIALGLQVLQSSEWAYTFSATDFSSSIYRAFGRHSDGGVEMVFPEFFNTRSQDLPVVWHDAGQFYWGRPTAWLDGLRIFDRHSKAIPIPRWRVQDIDEMDDWKRAEMIFKHLMNNQTK